jgi:hypothetical protein
MSAMTIDLAPTGSPSQNGEPHSQSGRTAGTRLVVRPGGGSARARSPQARPGRPLPAPSIQTSPPSAVSGCVTDRTVLPSGSTSWQLTDRGIAVILLGALMIVVAAVAVIGLTAFRVTSDSFQGYGQSQSVQR